METIEIRTGPDGAGRPDLSPEATAALCECYRQLAAWARQRRAELGQQVEAADQVEAVRRED